MIKNLKDKAVKLIESRRMLGLAVEEDCLMAADITYDGEEYHINNTASLVFPEGTSFEEPEETGKLIRQFLSDNGFVSRKAVIGIPAKWMMLRGKDIPPSKSDAVAGIIKIYAEREFSIGADSLVIDYIGCVDEKETGRLLLGAVRRKTFEDINETMRAAGLTVLSVTPASMALRAMALEEKGQATPDFFLYLRPGFAEILTAENGKVTGIKHVKKYKTSGIDQFITEIKRIIFFYPDHGMETIKRTLMIWDASNLDDQEFSDLNQSLSPQIDVLKSGFRILNNRIGASSGLNDNENSVSAALVPAFTEGGTHYLDFLNSRLDVKKSIIQRKQIGWAAALILILIIFLLNMFFTWRSSKNDVVEFKSKLEEMKGDITSAEEIIQRVTMARGWYSERPEIIRCLRELTLAFPVEGKVWATNLAINEDMKGIVSGKAVDEKSVIEVLDNLKDNKLFSNTQMIHIRENGQVSQEVSFSMSFSFKSKGF